MSKNKSNEDIAQRIKEIIVEKMDVDADDVTNEASFIESLGADSLDTVELIMELEDEFELEIPDEVAEKMATVGDAIKYVQAQANGA